MYFPSYQKRFLLITATLLHDLIVETNCKYNEEKSAKIAEDFISKAGYDSEEINTVCQLILSTKMPTHPGSRIEEIICDADVDNLGREDFFERGEEIRKELGCPKDKNWYKTQIKFLKNHKYYTKTAKKLRNKGIKKNIEQLENLLKLI